MSTGPAQRRRLPRFTWRLASLMIVGAGIALLVAANVHLVHVAVATQPDCVPHAKSPGRDGTFRAARSVC